jgi:hypothetical protein
MRVLSLIIGLCVFAAVQAGAQADAISTYFGKYMDDERFTMVYVSPKMFELVSKISSDEMDQDVKDVLKDLKGLRILTTETNSESFYAEAKKMIDTKQYEILMTVRDEGSNIEFLVKEKGDVIEELLLLVGGSDEFVLMSFVGNLNLKKISKLGETLDIDGAKHLEKLDKDH